MSLLERPRVDCVCVTLSGKIVVQVWSIHSKRSESSNQQNQSCDNMCYCMADGNTASSVEIIGDWPEPSVLLARVEMRLHPKHAAYWMLKVL